MRRQIKILIGVFLIEIQEIDKQHINEFWDLHWKYINKDLFSEKEDSEYFRSEEYRGAIKRLMQRETDRAHLIYFLEKGVRVGCCQFVTYKSEDGKCFILDYWVFEQFRGKGVGHRCFLSLCQYVKADGAKYFEINAPNERSRSFWKSLGFFENGVDEYGELLMKKNEIG